MNGTQQINTLTLPTNNRRIYPNDNTQNHFEYCNEISSFKSSLLNPSEVTFHDSDLAPKRKRLTTISSETTEWESHASTSTINASKKNRNGIDGGYGWIVRKQI
jgi:hypothetical protein